MTGTIIALCALGGAGLLIAIPLLRRRRTRTHQQRAIDAQVQAATLYTEVNEACRLTQSRVRTLLGSLGAYDAGQFQTETDALLQEVVSITTSYSGYAHSLDVLRDPSASGTRRRYKELTKGYLEQRDMLADCRKKLAAADTACDKLDNKIKRVPDLLEEIPRRIAQAEQMLKQRAQEDYPTAALETKLARAKDNLDVAATYWGTQEIITAAKVVDEVHIAVSEVSTAAIGLPLRQVRLQNVHAELTANMAALKHQIPAAQAGLELARAYYAEAAVAMAAQALQSAIAEYEQVGTLLPVLVAKSDPSSDTWDEAEQLAATLKARLESVAGACQKAQNLKVSFDEYMKFVRQDLRGEQANLRKLISWQDTRYANGRRSHKELTELASQLEELTRKAFSPQPDPYQIAADLERLWHAIRRVS